VILNDQFSRYQISALLDKWRKYMVIEEWKDEDYMDEDHKRESL
jgi:quinol monooxygenase YgiN